MASTSINPGAFWQSVGDRIPWRVIFTRSPLPMLALAASYGVYRFASFFVPWPVAVVQAAAFEFTYLGLAATRDLSEDGRRRARWISVGAVVVSIIYNSLAGVFDRNPEWLSNPALWAEWTLAIMHGLPLALVAYLVADLLLHGNNSLSEMLEQVVTDLSQKLADAQQMAADLRSTLAGKEQEFTALSQDFADIKQRAAQQAQDLAAAAQTFAAQQQAIADRDKELAALRQELDNVLQMGGVDVRSLAAAARRGGATWPQLAAWTGMNASTLRGKVKDVV